MKPQSSLSLFLVIVCSGIAAFAAEMPANDGVITPQLLALFQKLDALGRAPIKDATFVTLRFAMAESPNREWSEPAWLIAESDPTITVLTDDLIPHVYNKNEPTTVPSSWSPKTATLRSVLPADLEVQLKALREPEVERRPDGFPTRNAMHPEPATRALMAHAAWKNGLTEYCEPITSGDLVYQKEGTKSYVKAVMDDLAWRHFLRGVNLLMFADRKDVLPHLKLVLELSPRGEHAEDAKELLRRLEQMIAEQEDASSSTPIDVLELPEPARAQYLVSQLKDLRCAQWGQPGDIEPYGASLSGHPEPDKSLPTTQLLEMGMGAASTLIAALEDDTPTRTVYHWRDFHNQRVVWRVSDFAYTILCDMTKKELGRKPVVGFTLSYMEHEEKKAVVAEAKEWYAQNNGLSEDELMFGFFDGNSPREWATAGEYFLAKGDARAVAPLIENIPTAGRFDQGHLCILLAKFRDPAATDTIKNVMDSASEPSDRMNAAIALYELGDASGIPVAIDFAKLEEQPYGNWDEPVWLLMNSKAEEALDALMHVVTKGSPRRAIDVLQSITSASFGPDWGRTLAPVGCVEICPILITAMDRAGRDDYDRRVKDKAAAAFAVLTGRTQELVPGPKDSRFIDLDPEVFDEENPDTAARNKQIEALKAWYERNKQELVWDSEKLEITVKQERQS